MEERIGFKKRLEYLMEVLCYAYYCKSDNLISDIAFDEIEKIYRILFDVESCPMRGIEQEKSYTYGTKFIYDEIKCKQQIATLIDKPEEELFNDYNEKIVGLLPLKK